MIVAVSAKDIEDHATELLDDLLVVFGERSRCAEEVFVAGAIPDGELVGDAAEGVHVDALAFVSVEALDEKVGVGAFAGFPFDEPVVCGVDLGFAGSGEEVEFLCSQIPVMGFGELSHVELEKAGEEVGRLGAGSNQQSFGIGIPVGKHLGKAPAWIAASFE